MREALWHRIEALCHPVLPRIGLFDQPTIVIQFDGIEILGNSRLRRNYLSVYQLRASVI